jgi:hypothetical protein
MSGRSERLIVVAPKALWCTITSTPHASAHDTGMHS